MSARTVLALGSERVLTTTSTSSAATFTALLGPAHAPHGVLDVTWTGPTRRRRRRRERLGERLVVFGEAWLGSALLADREAAAGRRAAAAAEDVAALVALGKDALPALETLRRATRRVSELTRRRAAGEVVDIVAELDTAAQAVAALVGAATTLGVSESSTPPEPTTDRFSCEDRSPVQVGLLTLGVHR